MTILIINALDIIRDLQRMSPAIAGDAGTSRQRSSEGVAEFRCSKRSDSAMIGDQLQRPRHDSSSDQPVRSPV